MKERGAAQLQQMELSLEWETNEQGYINTPIHGSLKERGMLMDNGEERWGPRRTRDKGKRYKSRMLIHTNNKYVMYVLKLVVPGNHTATLMERVFLLKGGSRPANEIRYG